MPQRKMYKSVPDTQLSSKKRQNCKEQLGILWRRVSGTLFAMCVHFYSTEVFSYGHVCCEHETLTASKCLESSGRNWRCSNRLTDLFVSSMLGKKKYDSSYWMLKIFHWRSTRNKKRQFINEAARWCSG